MLITRLILSVSRVVKVFNLLIIKGNDLDTSAIDKFVEKHTKYFACKGKYIKNSNVELIYDIKLKNKKDDTIFNSLKDNLNIDTVNLVANNTDTMG